MLYVTQVAPYHDGPAGVHGVLEQSATAMAEVAEYNGLVPRHVRDVRELSADDVAGMRVVALFTIGETPWSDDQKAALLGGVRRGETSVVAVHAATDSCHGGDAYAALAGARFNGHPWTQDFTL